MSKHKEKISLSIFWSNEDESYIVECPQYDVIGSGETEAEAVSVFYELLDDYMKAKNEGRLSKTVGRPKKDNVPLGVNIRKEIKEKLDTESYKRGVNQGLFVEEAIEYYINHSEKEPA